MTDLVQAQVDLAAQAKNLAERFAMSANAAVAQRATLETFATDLGATIGALQTISDALIPEEP